MARVSAGAALHILRVHEALQPRQVAEQVAEAEGPRRRRPLQVLGRQRLQHPHRAGPGVAPVGEEGGGVLEHGGPTGDLDCLLRLLPSPVGGTD